MTDTSLKNDQVLKTHRSSDRISALMSNVVDQIAAGEVLEKPAHMVKELIENSLDAGSTAIELHLGEGGRSLTLIDNGRGFYPDDLSLALQRHTTSKLKSADDLWSLSTYGFRGEALASISAVSCMNIRTHRKGEKCVELKSEFGVVHTQVDSSQDFGTQIEIQRLYENTPARLKFLKTDAHEVMEIKKVLFAFGLCQPQMSLKLFYRDKLEYYWPAMSLPNTTEFNLLKLDPTSQELLERNKNILGTNELYGHMQDYGDVQVFLQFAPPHETAKSNRKLWTFVQNRWVQEPMILAAIRDGFQNTLLPGEYPIGSIYIYVPKDSVDVNVHPTKSKVKFKDQSSIYRAVRNTLLSFVELSPWRDEFLASPITTTQRQNASNPQGFSQDSAVHSYSEYIHNIVDPSKIKAPYQTNFELKAYRSSNQHQQETDITLNVQSGFSPEIVQSSLSHKEITNSSTDKNTNKSSDKISTVEALNQSDIYQTKNSFWSNLLVIGQVGKTYVVTQNQNEIVYIDQHAAHERCLFEKLWQGFKKGIRLETQRHLLPISYKVEDESVLDILMKHQEKLEKMGLQFEQSGPQYIEILETPAVIKDKAIVQSLEKMIEQILKFGESFIFEDVISDVFATMACHSAIRAGQILTHQEMNELLNLMDEYPTTSYCPHGRPVFVRYSFNQLEKDFCRRV